MDTKQDLVKAPWNGFSGDGWICGIMALVVSLGPLYSATPVTGISDDRSNADDVEAGLDRRKRLEGTFLERDDPEWLKAYRKRRDRWFDRIGLNIGASYDVAGLAAYGGGDPDYGFSGDFTVSGTLGLLGERQNRALDLVFRFRDRHAIGGLAASEVADATGGVIWNMIDGFNDAGFEVPDFYLLQHLPKHDLEIRYGQMTIDSHFDSNGLRSSKQAFFNRAFSSNPAVAFPRLGAGATVLWKPKAYGFDLTLGATTVQGTQNGNQVDLNFESSDFFKAVQLGQDFQLHDRPARVQAMVWHSDAVKDADTPEGYGISATFEYWMASSSNRLFVRTAWADGAAADTDRMITAGVAMKRCENDLLGFALGMGRDSSGSDDWQGVVESFYRWQIGPSFQVTPEVQIVFGNGLGESHSYRFVAGLRAELAF